MKTYTGMYIIRPTLTEDGFKAVVSEMTNLFTEKGCKVLEVSEWGVKDLAYEINDFKKGYYVKFVVEANNEIRMLLSKEHTQLAGHLIMNEYMPNVIDEVSKSRWLNALNVDAKIVVTESVADYVALDKTKPQGIELLKLEEAVLKCL